MTPEEQSKLAAQAGLETGDVFPGDTAWRRRFVELVADAQAGIVFSANERLRKIGSLESARVEALTRENAALREALSYYAESSNWRRDVRNIGTRKAWTKPAVASDRGGVARLVLMTMEGAK